VIKTGISVLLFCGNAGIAQLVQSG
jgi:hypothetical protein